MKETPAGIQDTAGSSDAWFRQLAHTIPSLVWTCRVDGYADFVNARWSEYTGQAAEQALGWGWVEVIHPEDREAVLRIWKEGMDPAQRYENELRYRRADGVYHWHLTRAVPRYDSGGRVAGWVGISIDIERQKQTSLGIEAKARSILETAVDGIVIIDSAGIIESFNRAAERIFGFPAREVIGRNVSMLMPEPHCYQHDSYIARYLTTGEKRIVDIGREVEGRRKDGSLFPLDLAVSEVRLGERRLFTGIVQDISERKRAEEALRRSEARLRQVIDLVPHMIFAKDHNGRFLLVNQAVANAYNTTVDALVGQDHARIHAVPVEAARMLQHDREVTEAGRPRTIPEEQFTDSNGKTHLLRTIRIPLMESGSDEPAVLGVATDITELKRTQDQLVQAERLAAIGQTVAMLAHESRNVLQRIGACAEMLELELQGKPEALNDLATIRQAQRKLHQLLEEVRHYAAPIQLERGDCDLLLVWRRAWSNLEQQLAGRGATLEEKVRGALNCRADSFRMEQVFRNLFENSLSACTDPVHIEVEAETVLANNAPALRIAVRDNGPGLTDEQREKIFLPFYTSKPNGTGLGMAIVRRIIEAHGGTIRVGQPLCPGTEIVFNLPL